VSADGFSVAQFGSYAPSVVLVAVVVGLGGLVQLWIPAPPTDDKLPQR
jgi:hypothetical protein